MNVKTTNRQFLFAFMLSSFSALGPFTVDMYLSALPQMMNNFNTTASLIQASLTASLLGLGLGQLIAGPLSDVHGRRKPLLISMLLYFLISIACAFSPNIGMFIVLRFIQGFVASAGLVISRAIVRDRYSGVEMVKFMALLTMISNVAPLISPTAGSTVTTFTSWIGVFIFLGFLGLVLTGIAVWGIKETLPVEQRVPGNFKEVLRNYGSLLRDRIFMGYALANGILFSGVFAYVAATPFIYQNMYGISPQLFSVLFALNGLGIIIGSQLVKRLAGRMDERRIFRIGLLVAFITTTIVLIVVLVHGPFIALFIAIFLFATAIGMIGPISFTLAMESQGHIAGSAAAVLGTLQFALGAVTSPLVGIAGENSAVPFGITIFMTSILAVISYLILVRRSSTASQYKHFTK
ncbi:multidrug effflux MFS transporter [Priestia megaterium]|uniref:multidrug effflux MFS transporter n=1 Tax=Priestia megaterium TaxID=1404 RepID=UPI0006F984C5|nr:multidrug effflux MFS transporter [Priestia megaterium]KQU25059.1 MFS transporter [Bacillus sp. Leaf75]MED4758877.1 multidrug effflux MFS transporter [Priestia megaterium]QLK07306.1 Multidrug resistance transporter, Bcr/CflA family [Priestia megaterium]